ncbi:hypothetical protein DFO83_102379 [Idiomarina loihiensis]|nr:hypothetical protein DFO83_102379 [Idiomarina loihiensis]TDP50252.1 hypothetical protein DET58_102375 [Idiomarina loihiensis]TDS24396.1 hypothetical protein DET62_1025 [Idiomarina sp. H2]
MNHYEKGRHTPDFSIIKLLADELKVPAYYFFCDSDEEAERALRLYALSDEQLEIIDKMLLEFTQK